MKLSRPNSKHNYFDKWDAHIVNHRTTVHNFAGGLADQYFHAPSAYYYGQIRGHHGTMKKMTKISSCGFFIDATYAVGKSYSK